MNTNNFFNTELIEKQINLANNYHYVLGIDETDVIKSYCLCLHSGKNRTILLAKSNHDPLIFKEDTEFLERIFDAVVVRTQK